MVLTYSGFPCWFHRRLLSNVAATGLGCANLFIYPSIKNPMFRSLLLFLQDQHPPALVARHIISPTSSVSPTPPSCKLFNDGSCCCFLIEVKVKQLTSPWLCGGNILSQAENKGHDIFLPMIANALFLPKSSGNNFGPYCFILCTRALKVSYMKSSMLN